jgi:hypothetical protein
MRAVVTWLVRRRLALAGALAVACFAVLVGRFWHPYYGFTKFLQFEQSVPGGTPVVAESAASPIYLYPPGNGYDGAMYVQIAFHPLLDAPELKPAIDSLSYRARRILGPAIAWALAGGNPARIAHVYAALNLAVWLAFAMILWRLLPVTDGRSWLAWAGLMFSAGALHAVRLALTDLLAVTLLAVAMMLAERRRERTGLAALAVAALARETVLLAVVAWWRGPWTSLRAWLVNALKAAAVAVPLALWMFYVRAKSGQVESGVGNFAMPVAGFIEKWSATVANLQRHPDFRWLMITTLLALAGLTVQALYIVKRLRRDDAWWRIGVAHALMMLFLGTAVWEGHPGAATRVLLPLSLAATVLMVRERAALGWIALGALSIGSGVLALWDVPHDAHELGAGRNDRSAFVARIGDGWYGAERHARDVWAWTAQRGTLSVEVTPATTATVRLQIGLRAISDREVEIREGDVVRWRGTTGPKLQWVELDGVRLVSGRAALELVSAAAPVPESATPGARALGFAVYGVRID